jgi:hypothetical protein
VARATTTVCRYYGQVDVVRCVQKKVAWSLLYWGPHLRRGDHVYDKVVDAAVMLFVVMRVDKEIDCSHASPVHHSLNTSAHSVLTTIYQKCFAAGCNRASHSPAQHQCGRSEVAERMSAWPTEAAARSVHNRSILQKSCLSTGTTQGYSIAGVRRGIRYKVRVRRSHGTRKLLPHTGDKPTLSIASE